MSYELGTIGRCTTRACTQCNKQCKKFNFAHTIYKVFQCAVKKWKKGNRSCRLCAEYTQICPDKAWICHDCRLEFALFQWSNKGEKVLCSICTKRFSEMTLDSSIGTAHHVELADDTCVCSKHSLEHCDECMVSFTLQNTFARKRNALGRDLTKDEADAIVQEDKRGVYSSRKICILDGKAVCPRSSKLMCCPCKEVTYCSKTCQKHHWTIHKMTCTVHAETKRLKDEKK